MCGGVVFRDPTRSGVKSANRALPFAMDNTAFDVRKTTYMYSYTDTQDKYESIEPSKA